MVSGELRWPQHQPRLSSAALMLRPWCSDDVGVLDEVWRDPDAVRLVAPGGAGSSCQSVGEFVDETARLWAQHNQMRFAACLPGESQPVAAVTAVADGDGRRCDLTYWVAPRARGRSVATYATETLVSWLLGRVEVPRVEMSCGAGNLAALRVAQHAGLQRAELDAPVPDASRTVLLQRFAGPGVRPVVEVYGPGGDVSPQALAACSLLVEVDAAYGRLPLWPQVRSRGARGAAEVLADEWWAVAQVHHGDELVGLACLGPPDGDSTEMARVMVHPGWTRRGVGTALVEALCATGWFPPIITAASLDGG